MDASADAEVEHAYTDYAKQNPMAAVGFLDALDVAMARPRVKHLLPASKSPRRAACPRRASTHRGKVGRPQAAESPTDLAYLGRL